MDFGPIFAAAISDLVKDILAGGAITILLAASFISVQSGSFHPVLMKVWVFFSGKPEICSPVIKQFATDQTDLNHFNFLTSLRMDSLQAAERLIKWSKEHEISVQLIHGAGHFFDQNKPAPHPSIAKLKKKHVVLSAGLSIICVLILLFAVAGTQYSRAVVKMNASGTWISLGSADASPLFGSERFRWTDCTLPRSPSSNFLTQDEIKIICTEAKDQPRLQAWIWGTVSDQVAALASLVIIAGVLTFQFVGSLRSVYYGLALQQALTRIHSRSDDPSNLHSVARAEETMHD